MVSATASASDAVPSSTAPELLVAERLQRFQRRTVAGGAQGAHLVEEPGGDHLLHARGDARAQRREGRVEQQDGGGQIGGGRGAPPQRRDRLARLLVDLQRAADADQIARADRGGRFRIDAGQPRVQRFDAVGRRLRAVPGADALVGRRRLEQAGDQRPVVEAGAADDDRQPPARDDVRDRGARDAAQRAAWNGSSGRTRSRAWWGTRRRSSAVGLAVPMSMPT